MAKRAKTEPGRTAYAADTDLAIHFGVSRATIWRWASDGSFPVPVKLSPQITRWRWADVEAWEIRQTDAT